MTLPARFEPLPLGAALLAAALLAGCGEPKPPAQAAAPLAGPYAFVGAPEQEADARLLLASGTGGVEEITEALEAGGSIQAADGIKRTPIFAAAFRDQPEAIRLLAGKGADVNAKDTLGLAPLHAAVAVGAAGAIRALLEAGADIHVRTPGGQTPLHLAASTNQAAIAELLLQRGAKLQLRNRRNLTPAELAAQNGHGALAATLREWPAKYASSPAGAPR